MVKKANSVSNNISGNYHELFPQEKKVADYVLNNMSEVVMLNISELATKCQTSEATVVRMCKHVGYDGYYQMRLLMSRDLGRFENQNEEEALLTTSKIFGYHAERVNHLSENIEIETLLRVSKILIESRMNHIIGVGNTVNVVMDLGFRLERYGVPCTYSMLPEHFYNHINLGNNSDSLVAITRSGASTQVIRAVEIAREKGMKIIVITGEAHKQLIEYADEVILVLEKNLNENMIIKPDSHLLELAVNDAILYCINAYNKIKNTSLTSNEDKEKIEILMSEFKL